jgi:hypothetical protein
LFKFSKESRGWARQVALVKVKEIAGLMDRVKPYLIISADKHIYKKGDKK